MKTDYLNEAKELLKNHYSPVESIMDESEYTLKKTLAEIHQDITNILPSEWIYKSDVYDIMKELGFKSFLYTLEATEDKKEKTLMVYLLDKKTAAL